METMNFEVIAMVVNAVVVVLGIVFAGKFVAGQAKAEGFTKEVGEAIAAVSDPFKVLSEMIKQGKVTSAQLEELAKEVTEAGGEIKDVILLFKKKK